MTSARSYLVEVGDNEHIQRADPAGLRLDGAEQRVARERESVRSLGERDVEPALAQHAPSRRIVRRERAERSERAVG